MSILIIGQLFSLFGCGVLAELAGFAGFIYPPLAAILIAPAIWLWLIIGQVLSKFKSLALFEKLLVVSLSGVWSLHLLQVLVPETGFDAIWYHLPIVAQFAQTHRIFYIPELYQSLNPLFTDLVFLLGYQIFGELGAKLVAYLFGISLVLVSYQLSRQFLNRGWSLIITIIISTFQVVAWQSASFYIDVAKAMWEIASLWALLGYGVKTTAWRSLVGSSLMFGASLATKLFSLALYPVMLVNVWLLIPKQKMNIVALFLTISLLVAIPFYLFTYTQVGNPFYSLFLHSQDVRNNFWFEQTIRLPYSLIELTLSRDYTSPIFLCLLPVFIYWLLKAKHALNEKVLLFFSAWQYLIWWYLPPTSTRYGLSGFITLLILFMLATRWLVDKNSHYRQPMFLTIFLLTVISIAPRIAIAQRSLSYLLNQQTKQEYVQQFYDGWIDEPLKKWHQL